MNLPDDKEVEKWFVENIGNPHDPCSASSAIYKFRLWLKERETTSPFQEAEHKQERITVAFLRDLESQVSLGKISYSRMVEIINEKIN